jgi:Domain of unknown function (DUF4260)
MCRGMSLQTKIRAAGTSGRDWRYRRLLGTGDSPGDEYDRATVLDNLPRLLLRAEGAVVAIAAVTLYFYADFPWWLLLVLALAPDLSMIGFAAGQDVGTATYNAAHTYAVPFALGAVGVVAETDLAVQLALVWITHIGVDRTIGYGLKYPSGFKDTHLQRV